MSIYLDNDIKLQPHKPSFYQLPPVVQPLWHWGDLYKGWHTDVTEELCRNLCMYYGQRYCILLDRARSGIFLLCKAFGLDGEWITTSLMHRPTAVVLVNHCAGVSFADVDESMTPEPASVERMISPRTCAILATHTYGKAADVAALRAIADQRGIALIENAVHLASGAQIDGRLLGGWGDASLLSFNVDKPLGGILGGALLTNRKDIWQAVNKHTLAPANSQVVQERIMTTYAAYRLKPFLMKLPIGRKHRKEVDGFSEIESFDIKTYQNYTPRSIHPFQARVALSCLKRLPEIVRLRTEHATILNNRLKDDYRFALPESTIDRPHTFTYYPLLVRQGSRALLGKHLARAGIESKWRLAPLHAQSGFNDARRDQMTLSEKNWQQHLLLPIGPLTTESQIDYLAKVLLEW